MQGLFKCLPGLLLIVAALLASAQDARPAPPSNTIVLIGGTSSEGPARHDHANAVRLLKSFLESARVPARIVAFERGWPDDPRALDGASTIVLDLDGLDRHPLLDATRRRRFDALMQRGVGLVALHQASTVPAGAAQIGLQRWLGAVRLGTFDRTTEWAELQSVAPQHPVARGVVDFAYRDEFYPTLSFARKGRITPILSARLNVQYRAGRSLVEDTPETAKVAWAFERPRGGRSFGFTGGHFLASLDQPMLRRTLLNAVLWTARIEVPRGGVASAHPDAATRLAHELEAAAPAGAAPRTPAPDATTFHHDPQRSGWFAQQVALTPASVVGPTFGRLWESASLDALDGQAPRLYASPLYVDRLTITAGPQRGDTVSAVIAASNHGFVYAVNASRHGDLAPGRIVWRTRLAAPCRLQPAPLDAVPTGVLSTPVIDLARGRLYVTSCDPQQRWQAYALDLGSGAVLPGWPVRLDKARLNALNHNAGPAPVAPTRRFDFRVQRGALNLSPDGSRLYVTFGETETGWLVSVDTAAAKIASAFAAVAMPHRGSGGIWGAGGPAVDADGSVFVVTGSGFNGFIDQAGDWTQSVLKLSDATSSGLRLEGTYTPFNHCSTAEMDIDLGSGGAALLPGPSAQAGALPLMVVGGKQGNAYLLNRGRLPGRLDRRPACSIDAASDASLLAPHRQPQFAGRGPLNVFGPYSEKDAALDLARARSVPAFFRDADGTAWVYLTGSTKAGEGVARRGPPSLARLRVVAERDRAPYLAVDRLQTSTVFENPGSPLVTSRGPTDAIVWVLDENAPRSAPLAGDAAPSPVLHAFDGATLAPLWRSAPGELHTSGKYNEPVFGGDTVIVGTDRIQAFGLGGVRTPDRHAEPAQPRPAALPQPDPPLERSATPVDAAAIYRQRCATCHDHPQGGIPPRAWLGTRPKEAIVEALTRGAMRAQANGLSGREIDALADHLK